MPQPLDNFACTPQLDRQLAFRFRGDAQPFLFPITPTLELRFSLPAALVHQIDRQADHVARHPGMLGECLFDRLVQLTKLACRKIKKEFCLPLRFRTIGVNHEALDARVRANALAIENVAFFARLQGRKLRTQFLERTILRSAE
jgi:hypothetical protein